MNEEYLKGLRELFHAAVGDGIHDAIIDTQTGVGVVAAQVIRDVRDMLLGETDWCQECGGGVSELDAFARDRGIEFEG